jgi:hypothetical protein
VLVAPVELVAAVAPVAAVEPVAEVGPVAEVVPVAPAGNTVVVEISWVVGGGGATTGATGVVSVTGVAATGVAATGVVATASGVGTVLVAVVTETGGSTGAIEATRRWWRIRWAAL